MNAAIFRVRIPRHFWPVVVAVIALHCHGIARGALIFDSYTPPSTISGFSSADGGLAAQILVTETTVISAISIYNQMLSTGNLKFVVLGEPSHSLLFQSAPVSFNIESDYSWKTSPGLTFTLNAGQQYWIGYVRSVIVNDLGDNVHEYSNGISSVGNTASISGYASPAFSHVVFSGTDAPIRLYAIPESACAAPVLTAMLAALRRRRLHS